MRPLLFSLCLLAAAPLLATPARAAEPAATQPAGEPFDLVDGDRVAFVGGTFFEREAKWGYIEGFLTSQFPDCNITFRNLGYAGDTVRCEARTVCEGWANFGPPQEGFDRLRTLIGEIKPTVVFIAYGMSESFEGEAALPKFTADYNKLMDMLAKASGGKPRFVLLGPTYHENMGWPLPDPSEHNRLLKLYSNAIKKIAAGRGSQFVDMFEMTRQESVHSKNRAHLTDDGIQLDQAGYHELLLYLGLWLRPENITIDARGHVSNAGECKIGDVNATPGKLVFSMTPDRLPPPLYKGSEIRLVSLHVSDLQPGMYRLTPDFPDTPLGAVSAESWAQGRSVSYGAARDQAEQLRQAIVAKNADYFNYWRHENDTYILGYRKHEQGKNAVELPEFIKLAEEKDKEIAKLRVPQPVTYKLERVEKAGK